jgi:hypothetical protein
LLKHSAELGFEVAQVQYAQRYPQIFDNLEAVLKNPERAAEYRGNARRYLESAAASGNWDAMFFLSRAYEEGTLADRNPAVAYAYAYALQQTGGYSGVIGSHLGNLQRQLSGEEVQQGQLLGQQIAVQCCSKK